MVLILYLFSSLYAVLKRFTTTVTSWFFTNVWLKANSSIYWIKLKQHILVYISFLNSLTAKILKPFYFEIKPTYFLYIAAQLVFALLILVI